MLFTILLFINYGVFGVDRRRLTTGWDTSDSADHNIDYVKAYIKCQKGMINMWYGESTNLPFGWKLCDGEDGRPNLMDRFPVGAGTKYKYGEHGGNECGKITLNVDQLPSHKHNIWSNDMTVSKNGKHIHWAKGTISGGKHWHKPGKLWINEDGEHEHDFETWTVKDGAHKHEKSEYWTDEEKEHWHLIDFESQPGEEHTHGHNLWVTETNSNHSHDISIAVDPIPAHYHELNPNKSYVEVEIPKHWHSTGTYKINDHQDIHKHKVEGWTKKDDGSHKHHIDFQVKNGDHLHKLNLETDKSSPHTHPFGDLKVSWDGEHQHWIPEVWTETPDDDEEHVHEIDAYEHSSWLTPKDKEKYGLAVDCVEKDESWKIDIDGGDHEHLVPRRQTEKDGKHWHTLSGDTGNDIGHTHNIEGETWNASHSHDIVGDTNEDGGHWHSIWGKTDEYTLNLDHTLTGYSGYNDDFKKKFKLFGWTKPNDVYTPTATATTTGKDGKHKHDLYGSILGEDEHKHNIKGRTQPSSHKHKVWGSCGNDIDDGIHKHWIKGKTKKWGKHSHSIMGTTDYSDSHQHQIDIKIMENDDHNHTVSGMTRYEGKNEEIDINPPYVAVWFICCTLENSPSFSWSASAEVWDIQKTTTTEKPKTTTTKEGTYYY